MLTVEENDMLTQTGPGTPMGDLFRRHWIPALLSEEIPGADCTPVRVQLLSENLVAFRDSEGNPGLIDAYCPHRGAPLFFGRNEECGLRCVYHGWKFDVSGKCVDLPNSPEGETYKDKVTIKAYPSWDKGGIIWTYMGPADKEPPKPTFEWLDFDQNQRYLRKYLLRCNYFQAVEGDYDPSHAFFLHSTLDNNEGNPGRRFGAGVFNSFLNRTYADYVDTDYGVMNVAISGTSDGQQQANIGHFYMPSYSSAGIAGPDVFSSNMRIPIDDESCYMYRLRWSYNPFTEQQIAEDKYGGYTYPDQIPGTFVAVENKDNEYLIDRVAQKNYSYTGIKAFPIQDLALVEDQWGPRAHRNLERLVSSDESIIKVRRRLLDAARALMEGQEPSGPSNPDSYRVHTARVTVPKDMSAAEAVEMVKARMVGPTTWEATKA
tara:strand:+ start:537 stop:1832 length:1296 start_codon:yes stop_codon:yes gene_type:complete